MKKTTLKLGNHRGNLRFWMEGKALAKHGFPPGSFFLSEFKPGKMILTQCHELQEGHRTVSRRAEDSSIVDICCKELRECFGEATHVNVIFKNNSDGIAVLIATPCSADMALIEKEFAKLDKTTGFTPKRLVNLKNLPPIR